MALVIRTVALWPPGGQCCRNSALENDSRGRNCLWSIPTPTPGAQDPPHSLPLPQHMHIHVYQLSCNTYLPKGALTLLPLKVSSLGTPGSQWLELLHFHCQGHGFDPSWGSHKQCFQKKLIAKLIH